MAKSVELAHAPYCWLFSADDVMEPGALTRVLAELRAGCDIYVCGLTLCSIDMVPLRRHRVMAIGENADFELAESGERREYFRHATTSTAFFSYMSSLVINRVRWIRAGSPDEFMGSCWAHVARIFGMIPDGLRVRYLADSYLLNRGGNDSFQEGGLIHRIGIAVNGYWRLADTYFGPTSLEARNIRRAVGNEYSLRYLLSAKWGARAGARHKDERDLDSLVAMLWQDGTLSNRFKHLAFRRAPLRLTRAIYRTLRYGSLSSWSDVFHVQD
jgi:abequosyltransferase